MNIAITTLIFWTIVTYIIASIPFSLIIGWVFLGVDIRNYGDGNPGATNVKRAGGSTVLTGLAIIMDGFKGLFPVGIPYWLMGWTGYEIVPLALAAVLGHSFSIFLGFKGGKSVAITHGIWTGILMLEALLLMPTLLVIWVNVVEESEWAVMLLMFSLLAYLILTNAPTHFYVIWLGNLLIVVYRHKDGLTSLPTLRRRNGA